MPNMQLLAAGPLSFVGDSNARKIMRRDWLIAYIPKASQPDMIVLPTEV